MFGVVYSRLQRGGGISLWGAMAHPVFPPPPAGAASSGPLVDLGQPIPDVAGLCRTERAQTRVARIGSPMDSPSMGVPWARGAHRGTFMPPFFARCPQHPLLFGWGLEYGRASLYGQGTFPLPGGRSSRIRAHWSPGRRLEAMASLTQWTEWGWYVSFAGLASTTQGIEFVVHARPAQHPHFRGIYASTSGRWRAEWAGDHWSVLFGAGPYGYSRWALHPHNPGW